jgi:multidrug efflux pump
MVGAREVMFTVLSMSLSLIAVFAPILLMSGLMGGCSANSPSPCRWRS